MTHDRPYRAALSPEQARAELDGMVRAGVLEQRAVNAVPEAAGDARLEYARATRLA